ncbi:hypothetical protein K9N50_02755 [bacterium]|nr:hypothetical protein [bacterium]
MLIIIIIVVVAAIALMILAQWKSTSTTRDNFQLSNVSEKFSLEAHKSVKESKTPPLIEIGELNAVCPYCGVELKKKPGRKTKCRDCENFIYVRTRPIDQKKILIREDQIEQIEEQWAIANGTYEEYCRVKDESRRRWESARYVLKQRFSKDPSENDVQWYLFNEDLIIHAKQKDWGLYRNTRMQMAFHLEKEGRFNDALTTLLEVCYLDLNGPNNLGGMNDPELLKEYPPWDVNLAFTAPAIVDKITKLVKQLNISIDDVQRIFSEVAESTKKSIKTPVIIESAWKELKKQIL